jgi:hypothetical protein
VHARFQQEGDACLPLVLVDDAIAWSGAYPRREALARAAGLASGASQSKPLVTLGTRSCCTPKSGCC